MRFLLDGCDLRGGVRRAGHRCDVERETRTMVSDGAWGFATPEWSSRLEPHLSGAPIF